MRRAIGGATALALAASILTGTSLGGWGTAAASPRAAASLIYDFHDGVVWLGDADLPATQSFGLPIGRNGAMTYATAVRWVAHLNSYDGGKGWLGHHDWTLPVTPTPYSDTHCSAQNKAGGGSFGYGCLASPLAALYAVTMDLAHPDTAVPVPDTRTGPFHDFRPYLYWTAHQTPRHPGSYDTLSFNTGWPGANVDKHNLYALPMIPGNPFHTPSAGALNLSADHTTVFQPAAGANGVTWLADADLARTQALDTSGIDADGSMTEETAVTWTSRLSGRLEHGSGKDGLWQLPTQAELAKLYAALPITHGEPVVPTPTVTVAGFQHLQPYLYWSCAGPSLERGCAGAPKAKMQWSFSFGAGYQGTDETRNRLYAMVYYPAPAPRRQPSRCPPQKPGKPITCT